MNHDIQRSRKVLEPPHATGQLSQWLHAGLKPAGFDAILLETRHVKAALSAMTVKTDRNDARGLAQLIRMGRFRPVHAARCRAKGSKATSSIPRRLRGPAGADGRRLTRSMERSPWYAPCWRTNEAKPWVCAMVRAPTPQEENRLRSSSRQFCLTSAEAGQLH